MFRICTIVNDLAQYRAMRDSFIAAGFAPDRCSFRLYDNSQGNEYDPFRVISSLNTESPHGFVILCHQDIRLDRGVGYEELLRRLDQLTAIDGQWAVAGNFGITLQRVGVGKVNDPQGTSCPASFPQKVISLDENFLVFRPDPRLCSTPELYGFHLYGTDVCLNAYLSGLACYVIDFQLTHLSGGDSHSPEFQDAARRFAGAWNKRFAWAVVDTPCTALRMSRWGPVRKLLNSSKVNAVLDRIGVSLVPYPEWARSREVRR